MRVPVVAVVVTFATICCAVAPGHPSSPLLHLHLPKEVALCALAIALLLRRAAAQGAALDLLDAAALSSIALLAAGLMRATDVDAAARIVTVWSAFVVSLACARGLPAGAVDACAVVVVGCAAWVILESAGALPPLAPRGYAPGALLGHRNNAAHVFVLFLPWLIERAAAGAARARSAATIALPMVVGAVLLTRSRTALLALLLCAPAALLLVEASHRRRAIVLAALLAGAAAWQLPAGLVWRQSARASIARLIDGATPSAHGRLVQATTSLQLLAERPLAGVGPGQWSVHYPRVAAPDDPTVQRDAIVPVGRLPTSDVIAILAERGALGTATLLALVVLAWRRRRRDAAALLPIGIAASVIGALDVLLHTAVGAACVALLIGAQLAPVTTTSSSTWSSASSPASAPASSRRAVVAGIAAAFTISLLVASGALAAVRLNAHVRLARARSWDAVEAVARDHPTALPPHRVIVADALFRRDCARARRHIQVLLLAQPFVPRLSDAARTCQIERTPQEPRMRLWSGRPGSRDLAGR